MKKNFLSIAVGLLVAVSFSACEQEENWSPSTQTKTDDALGFRSNCDTYCIDETTGDAYATSKTETVNWGGPSGTANTKHGTVRVWNTLTHIVYEFTSTVNISDLVVDGTSSGLGAAANTPLIYTLPLSAGWEGCDMVAHTFALAGSGPQIAFGSVSYSLIPICSCTYEGNAFSGEAGAGSCGEARSATFTFSSEDGVGYVKIQGGLTNFTLEDATVTVYVNGQVSNAFTVVQVVQGGSNNRRITVTGSLGECSNVSVHVSWNSTNSGTTITGEWSAKDANGVDLAAPVAGLVCSN